MFCGVAGDVAVRFIRELNVSHDSAVALYCLIEPFALNRKGPGIVVGHAMDQQNGMLDLVRMHERRDFDVHLRSLPQRAALTLESEGSQCPVVGSATGHA